MKKGFTLFELVFVIVILGILSSVAIPKFEVAAAEERDKGEISNIKDKVISVAAEYGVDIDTLKSAFNDESIKDAKEKSRSADDELLDKVKALEAKLLKLEAEKTNIKKEEDITNTDLETEIINKSIVEDLSTSDLESDFSYDFKY